MKQCQKCIFYDKEYDELFQSGDDIVIIGEEDKEKHYCRLFDGAIDHDIITDRKECNCRVKK